MQIKRRNNGGESCSPTCTALLFTARRRRRPSLLCSRASEAYRSATGTVQREYFATPLRRASSLSGDARCHSKSIERFCAAVRRLALSSCVGGQTNGIATVETKQRSRCNECSAAAARGRSRCLWSTHNSGCRTILLGATSEASCMLCASATCCAPANATQSSPLPIAMPQPMAGAR